MKKLILLSTLFVTLNAHGYKSGLWVPLHKLPYNTNHKELNDFPKNMRYEYALDCEGTYRREFGGRTQSTKPVRYTIHVETLNDPIDPSNIPIKINDDDYSFDEFSCKANQKEFVCAVTVAEKSEDGWSYDFIRSIRIDRFTGKFSSQLYTSSDFYNLGAARTVIKEGNCSVVDKKF